MLPPEVLGEIVNRTALKYGVRVDVVMCIVLQESNCNPFAFRYEPAFYSTYVASKGRSELTGWVPKPNDTPSLDSEKMARSTSWGLMQCMGDSARWCAKFSNPYLTALCDPELGVDAGCQILKYYLDKEKGDYRRALSRYNAGTATSERGKAYAEKIFKRIENKEHLKFLKGS